MCWSLPPSPSLRQTGALPGSERWFFEVPGGGLFVGVGEGEEGFLAEGFAQELQADGEFRVFGEAAGQAYAADPG